VNCTWVLRAGSIGGEMVWKNAISCVLRGGHSPSSAEQCEYFSTKTDLPIFCTMGQRFSMEILIS
jgi:hypothetical protein